MRPKTGESIQMCWTIANKCISPTAVSLPIGCDLELMHVQHTLPKKELPQSDLDCLNLNIAVPADTTPSSKLPVFVFIHGGGLVIGANSWPQFDYTRLIQLSVEKKLPIVAVSIKYGFRGMQKACANYIVIAWAPSDFLHLKSFAKPDTRPTMVSGISGWPLNGLESTSTSLAGMQITSLWRG